MSANGGYEQYLPALFQDDPFWVRFLKPFERLLSTGATVDGSAIDGLEQVIDRMHERFVPELAPQNFLAWLAGWLALTLREDWDELAQRTLIRRISGLYPGRGTRAGIEAMLALYLAAGSSSPPSVSVVEALAFQVGVHSTVGVDTWVGGDLPHHFTVRVDFPASNLATFDLRRRAVIDIVEREKPAHTIYDLEVLIPTMQVGVRSTVGVDTVLGNKLV